MYHPRVIYKYFSYVGPRLKSEYQNRWKNSGESNHKPVSSRSYWNYFIYLFNYFKKTVENFGTIREEEMCGEKGREIRY